MTKTPSTVTIKITAARESIAWDAWPGIAPAMAKALAEFDTGQEEQEVGFHRGLAGRPRSGMPSGFRPHGWVQMVTETAQVSALLEAAEQWCAEHPFVSRVAWEVSARPDLRR